MQSWKNQVAAGIIALIAVFVLAIGPALAQEDQAFTAEELEKLFNDYPAFVKWAQENEQDFNQMAETGQNMQISSEITAYLGKRGWEPQRFFNVLARVGQGFAALKTRQSGVDMSAQMKAQREMIANNPQIPEAQKKEMLAQLDQGIEQTAGMGKVGEVELTAEEQDLIIDNQASIEAMLTGE